MGSIFSKIYYKLILKKDIKVLILGLDAAGKTTILFQFKIGKAVNAIPTIGFNVESIQNKNIKLNIWDTGGGDKIKELYHHYYPDTKVLIFVIDSSDKVRINKAKELLNRALFHKELKDAIFLILANKKDIAVMSVTEIIEILELNNLKERVWNCIGTSAITGEGIKEGLDWVYKNIKK